HVETTSCKTFNAFIRIVHAKCNAVTLEIKNFKGLRYTPSFGSEGHCQFSFAFYYGVSSPVLITKCMPSDDDRCSPVGHQPRDVFYDNWFAEYGTVENVTDCSVRALPHT